MQQGHSLLTEMFQIAEIEFGRRDKIVFLCLFVLSVAASVGGFTFAGIMWVKV